MLQCQSHSTHPTPRAPQAEVLRTMLPGRVINKLVFDSLEPPKASNLGGVGDDADGSDGGDPGDCTGVEAGGCTGGDADGDACAGLAFSGADAPEAAKPAALSAHATADDPANAADAPCGAAEAAPGAGEGEERSSGGRGGSCGIRRGGGSGSGAQCTFDYAKDLPAWWVPAKKQHVKGLFCPHPDNRETAHVFPSELCWSLKFWPCGGTNVNLVGLSKSGLTSPRCCMSWPCTAKLALHVRIAISNRLFCI
eukprot:366421-Chlamydomonas_euryale.AAC.21